MKQPIGFDIMTETHYITFAIPLVIKEKIEMISSLIQYFIRKDTTSPYTPPKG